MKLPNIESFIDDCDGQINVGYTRPVGCIAVANDEHQTLVMLKRQPQESFESLMMRLDHAIELAIEHEQYTDEINT